MNTYDSNLQTLFIYATDGSFISSKKIVESMSSIYPVYGHRYIGRKKYQGDRVQVPTLAILDEDLDMISNIDNRNLTSGIGVFDYCYAYDDHISYWEFLNDTIYTIKDNKVFPEYYIDFQKNKVPEIERVNREIGEIIEYLNSNSSWLATGIRYVQEDINDLWFIFTFQGNMNIARYNKESSKVSVCYFYDSKEELKFQYFMKHIEGYIILSAYDPNDEESNPKLLVIKF